MSQNQQNKPYETALNQCRSEIDTIDTQILDLIAKRMRIVEKVRDLKKSHSENFFIKSGREADMIRELLKKCDPLVSKPTVASIWRKIITSSNMLEQNIKIALHNPQKYGEYNYILREYYSDLVPIISHDSVNNVVMEIEKNSAQIAVFALLQNEEISGNEEWWINLANNKLGLKVFAQIPFIKYSANKKQSESPINLLAMAIKDIEKSQSDHSLFCIELDKSISRAELQSALQESAIKAKILKTSRLRQVENIVFYLIETDGFYDEKSNEIESLKKHKIKPFVKFLGLYPQALEV